jgi:hypothetical protein
MDEKQLNAWIQQAIDGILAREEKDQLDKLMEQDPKLKQRFAKMEQVAELLNQVGSIDPPKYLKNNIMNRIDRERYQLKKNWLQSWLEWFYKPKPRVVLAFCSGMIFAGMLLILLISGWFSKYPVSNFNLIGTIGVSDHPVIEKLYDLPLNTGEYSGRIKVNRFEQLLWLDMNFSSAKDIDIKLKYNPGILHFDQSLLLQSKEMSLQTLDKQIIISGRQGGQAIVFFVKNKPPATEIEVTVSSDQVKSLTQKIELN